MRSFGCSVLANVHVGSMLLCESKAASSTPVHELQVEGHSRPLQHHQQVLQKKSRCSSRWSRQENSGSCFFTRLESLWWNVPCFIGLGVRLGEGSRTSFRGVVHVRAFGSSCRACDGQRSSDSNETGKDGGRAGGQNTDGRVVERAGPSSGGKTENKTSSALHYAENYSKFFQRLARSLPPMQRPTREDFLNVTTGFWQRLRVRFKWFAVRSFRKFNADDISAFLRGFCSAKRLGFFWGRAWIYGMLIKRLF